MRGEKDMFDLQIVNVRPVNVLCAIQQNKSSSGYNNKTFVFTSRVDLRRLERVEPEIENISPARYGTGVVPTTPFVFPPISESPPA